jgi:hypothetical protein
MNSGIDFCGIDKLKLMHRNLADPESPATREYKMKMKRENLILQIQKELNI